LSPSNTSKSLTNIDFSHIGNSVSKDTSAFKKIQTASKISNSYVELDAASNNSVFRKINNLYTTNNTLNNNSHFYGSNRQHNFSSSSSILPAYTSLVDNNSFKSFFNYSLQEKPFNGPTTQFLSLDKTLSASNPSGNKEYTSYKSITSLLESNRLLSLNTLTDKQNLTNSLKPIDTNKKVSYDARLTSSYYDELVSTSQNNFFS
jgi:hypothetical protein